MREKNLRLIKEKIKDGSLLWLPKQAAKYIAVLASMYTHRAFAGPIMASLMVTYRCNLDCVMCDFPARAGAKEFDTGRMKKIIDELADIGTNVISFTGGEPLFRKDIFELIAHAKRNGLVTQMPSNGTLLTEERAQALIDSGLDALTISIDGACKETHDRIRGINGSYEKAIQGVQNIVSLRKKNNKGPTITLSMVINKYNVKEILDMQTLASKLEADNMCFFSEEGEGSKLNPLDQDNQSIIQDVLDRLIEEKKQSNIIDNSTGALRLLKSRYRGERLPIRCVALNTTIFLDCYGNVFPCNFWLNINKPVMKIDGASIKDVWTSREYSHLRKKLRDCRRCYYMCHVELSLLFDIFGNVRRFISK
ncbi:MAG TPA: radical SAM/SPASM domain-containing protein [Candidatus Brocadiia bacterium]|nr:radical SAM protein [Candidatus Brocadiales bacterium]